MSLGLSVTLFATDAQTQPPQQPMQQQQLPQVDMSEDKIKIFVGVLEKVEVLRQDLSKKIVDSEGNVQEDKVQKVNQEFQEKATQIIEDEGMSVETYSQYAQRMQLDPQFLQKIQQMVQ